MSKKHNINLQTLSLKDLKDRLIARAKRFKNSLLVGFPGIGKSEFVKSIAKELGYKYLTYIPAMGNPSHINGLPFNNDGKAEFLFYEFMEAIMNSTKPTIVHIQDFIQATPIMQAALMSLIQERSVNNKPIPDCVTFIIDTNDASHGAGGTKVIAPVLSRTAIFEFPIDAKGWIEWAFKSKRICKEIILYIHAHPDALCKKEIPRGIEAYPTPRTWEHASEWVEDGFTDATTLASAVGPEEGQNCAAFISDLHKYGNMLPKILNNPETAPLMKELSERYGVLLILANHFEKENVPAIVKYFKRYGSEEMLSVLLNIGASIHPDSKETKEYIKNFTA